MIGRLLRFALEQRFITIVLAVALIGVGIYSFRQLKVEAYPDISDTQVVVITTMPGQAAEEMEQQVTIPIERALNSVPNVIARRSRTIYGLSVVEVTFSYDTNDYFARQVVLERLRSADLPDGVVPDIAPLTTPIGEMYRFRLEGGGLNDVQLRELEDWVVGAAHSPGARRCRCRAVRRAGQAVSGGDLTVFTAEIWPDRETGRGRPPGEQPECRRRTAQYRPAVHGDPRRRTGFAVWPTSRISCWRPRAACRSWSVTSARFGSEPHSKPASSP